MKLTLFVCSIIAVLLLGRGVNALADDAELKERFVHAYSFYQEGQYQEAFAELEKFLKMYPNSEFADEATFCRGKACSLKTNWLPPRRNMNTSSGLTKMTGSLMTHTFGLGIPITIWENIKRPTLPLRS